MVPKYVIYLFFLGSHPKENVNLFYFTFIFIQFNITINTPNQQKYTKYMKPKPKIDTARYVLSPMPGTVVNVLVKEGDTVDILK